MHSHTLPYTSVLAHYAQLLPLEVFGEWVAYTGIVHIEPSTATQNYVPVLHPFTRAFKVSGHPVYIESLTDAPQGGGAMLLLCITNTGNIEPLKTEDELLQYQTAVDRLTGVLLRQHRSIHCSE